MDGTKYRTVYVLMQSKINVIHQRWIKTCEMKLVASQQFSSIVDTIPGILYMIYMYVWIDCCVVMYYTVKVTDELVEKWIQNQICTMSHGFQQTSW